MRLCVNIYGEAMAAFLREAASCTVDPGNGPVTGAFAVLRNQFIRIREELSCLTSCHIQSSAVSDAQCLLC